jgi:hypothetical protein
MTSTGSRHEPDRERSEKQPLHYSSSPRKRSGAIARQIDTQSSDGFTPPLDILFAAMLHPEIMRFNRAGAMF